MRKAFPFIVIGLALVTVAVLSSFSGPVVAFLDHGGESEMIMAFLLIAVIFLFNFIVANLSITASIPSFVVAIFFGIAGHEILAPIVENKHFLGAFVTFAATLILFGGGLEVPFHSFRKLFWKIMLLSFLGLFITAFLFSELLSFLGGREIAVATAVLLGAILASTDPAAIIPVLRDLQFRDRAIKDIVISESAVTDVTGTILTVIFLGMVAVGGIGNSVISGYGALFSLEAGKLLFNEMFFGVVFGIIGFLLLEAFNKFKKKQDREHEADAAYFLFVPILCFALAAAFGGSGYLAAFIMGLLFVMKEHIHATEKFFNHTIEGFLKPAIFLLLGALVNPAELIEYAGIGIVCALLFMFVIRPIAVFISLGAYLKTKKSAMTIKDLLFISFVRETGAIPAVLLVTVASSGISGIDGLVPIGMWVILATLIIEPPLTPFIARKLGVAEANT